MLRYILQRDRARHATLLALVTVSIGLTLTSVHLLRALIDRAIPAGSRSLALTLGGAMLAAAAARVVVDYAKAMVSERVRQDVIARLRNELLAHLLRMPPDFFAANSVGQLMNKVQTDTGRLGMSVGWIFVEPSSRPSP
ncbi:MAG: ABC transporter transmembrane domain-containing protein [Polyangiales bacterium]